MTSKKGVILLSSGLDSVVSLVLAKEKCDIILSLTFDYGQKAAKEEIEAAKNISKKYNIKNKTIKLPFLKNICSNSLTDKNKNLEFEKIGEKSAKSVWIPNRNGLFINIAASFSEALGADYVIIGANKEEAETFPDNSKSFIEAGENLFKYSTMSKVKILAPCLNCKKPEIVNLGIKKGVDFTLIKSCYNSKEISGKTHCGKCESCIRLKQAILKSDNKGLINLMF